MKRILCATLVAFSGSSFANTDASEGIYASVKAGISHTEFKNSSYKAPKGISNNRSKYEAAYPSIYAAVGYDFSKIASIDIRTELEYNYKDQTDFNPTLANKALKRIHNQLTTQSLMLNGYYDLKNTTDFTPYVNAGVGFTHISNKQRLDDHANSSTDSDNNFSWSAGVGVAYAVTQNTALDLSYRYVDEGKFTFNTTLGLEKTQTDVKVRSNEYLLGVRYNF